MRSAFAPLALAALVAATPVPQSSSSNCQSTYSGTFNIQVVNQTSSSKRDLEKRQDSTLTLSLSGGDLKDSSGRTGYIASNSQFQFDAPPQANALSVGGYAVCADSNLGYSVLTIDGDNTWYKCLSGTFYNIYDENEAGQCSPVYIQVLGAASGSGTGSSSAGGSSAGGSSASASSAGTSAPASQLPDGQPTASPAAPVTQISDAQPQAPSAAAPVTQISDGQPQASTGVASPVSQIGDGQPQAPTSTAAPVSQIGDGQPQAPTSVASPISQISDGQPQAPTGGNSTISSPAPSATVEASTGDASSTRAGLFGLAVAVLAVAML